MSIVAVLRPCSTPGEISEAAWESLIQTHPQLTSPAARRGINPFTKEPIELPPRRDLAIVVERGRTLGTIERAQDGSDMLLVRDEGSPSAALLDVARDVAVRLGIDCDTEHALVVLSRRDEERQEAQQPPAEDPLERAIRLWRSGDAEGAVAHYMAAFGVDVGTAMRALARHAASR